MGRYFGVAFGSFFYDGATNNQVYTRGPGNAMKLFSFRPLTQLFSFKSNCGTLQDRTVTSLSGRIKVVSRCVVKMNVRRVLSTCGAARMFP